ncbi:MBL fold metallo-hydrolase [Cytobacillus solani]|uniref:MBL fold metallo-hydrolase n=1 Tax=Cytobacillus solani TaxID=1637975 RepID=A0A0Q3T8Y5_9BACI|nr:MBL fold metallo-hydrolase [Cytobacillus solani]KQL19885.1 MBL fold metallo-hydrolase [Cytobacillus solani]
MKMTKIETIYQMTFLANIFPVNCYLVEEEDTLTLIDAALPFSAKGILEAAKKIGKPITRIVLTHAHDDHVGALDHLKAALPHADVLISERDARLMEGDRSLDEGEAQTPIKGGVPKSLKTRANILLHEGDRIGSLLSIATPGHTPGSFSFLDTRNQSLIAGDAFQSRGGMAVAGQVQLMFPFPAFGTWSKEDSVKSALKIRDYSPALLAIGHGKMLLHPHEQIELAIKRAEYNLGKGR